METNAPLWPFPMIVTSSRSPPPPCSSNSSGRAEMSPRPVMWYWLECRHPSSRASFRGGAAAGAVPRPPSYRSSDARISTGGPPSNHPTAVAIRQPAAGSIPPLGATPHAPSAPASSSGDHWRPRFVAPPLSRAPCRGCIPVPAIPVTFPPDRRAVTAQPSADNLVRNARFQPARASGTSLDWSGGGSPRSRRSPLFQRRECC